MTILARWKQLRTHRMIALVDASCVLFFLASVTLIVWRANTLPPAVPLWYSRPWGEEQLAHPLWLLVLPAGAAAWHGINVAVSTTFLYEYPVFGRVLFLASLLVTILSFVTLVQILFLVSL